MTAAQKAAAEAAVKKAEDQIAKNEADFAAYVKQQETDYAAMQKTYDDALAAMKASFEALKTAQQKAFNANQIARDMQEEQARLNQERQMKLRRAAFNDKFKHVWDDGQPGISIVQYTIDSMERSSQMLSYLFEKHLIADAQEYMQDLHRVNLAEGAMSPTMNRHKI